MNSSIINGKNNGIPTYEQARQTKIWFPQPVEKTSSLLLNLDRNRLSTLVQFTTGHNKLNRHMNIINNITNLDSCRFCQEEEEESFHLIGECPALTAYRLKVFGKYLLDNPPEWKIWQVLGFLKKSGIESIMR